MLLSIKCDARLVGIIHHAGVQIYLVLVTINVQYITETQEYCIMPVM
jgi:hypothetical protein